MTQGLLWLPLLCCLGILTWLGWSEFSKLQSCQTWAQQFERSKYDVAAVLGWNQGVLTWGKPTRQGPQNLQVAHLDQVQEIQIQIDKKRFSPPFTDLPSGRRIWLVLLPQGQEIPFTQTSLAVAWGQKLTQVLSGERDQA